MSVLPDLSHRNLQPELMDQPDLDPKTHRKALSGLRRINFLSGSVGILWPAIRRLAEKTAAERIRVLDIGSGGGDLAIALWKKSRRHSIPLEIVGVDISDVAVESARTQAKQTDARVQFEVCDALTQPLPDDFDVVMCSLFLHHMQEPEAVQLLRTMAAAANRLVLVNDLRRCATGYWLAIAACHLFTRSHIVHVDGPRSVAGAFTIAEVHALCDRAELENIRIQRRWPFRYLLSWERV